MNFGEPTDQQVKYEIRKADLIWALRTRVLSPEEMEEVRSHGPYLVVQRGETFRQAEIEQRFNDLMLLQFRMRLEKEAADEKAKQP